MRSFNRIVVDSRFRSKQKAAGSKQSFVFLLLMLISAFAAAQTTTRNDGGTTTTTTATTKKKILIIPWEPRMFNCSSDISRAISTETGQKYDEMQQALRKGLVDQMKLAFGATCTVQSLIDDTAKMKEDLHYVYTCTSMSYTPTTFPLNPTKADSAKLTTTTGVANGQVQTSDDAVDKYMTTVVISPSLLLYLKKKYFADYVVFVNEVDMDNDLGDDPYNLSGSDSYKRYSMVHYTIFDTNTSLRIAAGKSKGTFAATTNTPKKIVDGSYATISKDIYAKYLVGIKPS